MRSLRATFFRAITFVVLCSFLSSFFTFLPKPTYAATYTWDGGGATNNWNEAANWSSDTIPGTGDIALFNATSTKDATIDASISVAGIEIASGYSGTITQGAGSSVTVGASNFSIASGSFIGGNAMIDVNQNFTQTGGTFTSTQDSFMVFRNFIQSGGSFFHNNGSIVFDGNTVSSFDVVNSIDVFNLEINKGNAQNLNISSGDIIHVYGQLTLTNGTAQDGSLYAYSDIEQASTYDSGDAMMYFANDAVDQLYEVNGGFSPIIVLDSVADASDEILMLNDGGVSIETTAGFSGAIPLNNSGDYQVTVETWTQVGGTYDASAQTEWLLGRFILSTAGTFIAPQHAISWRSGGVWDVDGSQEFNDVTIDRSNLGAASATFSGDTIVVNGNLALVDVGLNDGTVLVEGNITQSASFTGGSANIYFTNESVVQTYEINGGTTPVIILDSAPDADDDINLNAVATVNLRTTAGFSGNIPFNNPSDFIPGVLEWIQVGGTYDASTQSEWLLGDLTVTTNGTFLPPEHVIAYRSAGTWDVDGTQEFTNLTVDRQTLGSAAISISNDTIIVNEELVLGDIGVNNGIIEARGNVTINSGYTSNTSFGAVLSFTGGAVQTFDLTGATGGHNTDLYIQKTGGSVQLQSALVLDGFNQDFLVQEGVLDLSGFNVTVNGTNGTFQVEDGGVVELYGNEVGTFNSGQPDLQTGSTVRFTGDADASSDTYTITNFLDTYANFEIASADAGDVFVLGEALDVNGDLSILEGELDVSASNYPITVAGDWTNASTFTPRNGLVTFNGTSQTIFGSTTFYNLAKNVTTEDTITLEAGQTQTIQNDFDFTGIADEKLFVRSTTDGVQSSLDPEGAVTVEYLDLKDNANVRGTDIFCQVGCTDSGNNDGWTFPGVFVSEISNNTTEDGATATFTMELTNQPTDDVTVAISSSDTTEGTIVETEVVFTDLNWNIPQEITVTGINDDIDDGDIVYQIVTGTVVSDDPVFGGGDPDNVEITNIDNDVSSVFVSDISNNTTEDGATATFSLVLTSQPSGNVVVTSTSNDATEGLVTAGATRTFTTENWNIPQTVTVTGQDDALIDGDVLYDVVVSINQGATVDPLYDATDPDDVTITNIDNDIVDVVVTISGINTQVHENGTTDSYTLVLTMQPTDDVVVDLSYSGEITTDIDPVTFTDLNWNTPQTVTVSAVNDDIDETNEIVVIEHTVTSDDPNYNGIEIDDVSVTVQDNDTRGVTVSAISGNTTEAGGTATFTVVLNSEPEGDVVITSASNDTTEGVVTSGASLTFNSATWDTPQTVTVTGQDDGLGDGNVAYTIVVATDTVATTDNGYDSVNPNDVSVTNEDDGDAPGFSVSLISNNTTEAGGTATFTVELTSEPIGDVVINSVSNDATEGVVTGGGTLTFIPSEWNVPQTVTVTGQDDDIDDGNIAYTIQVSIDDALTDDGDYDVLADQTVNAQNTDNDTRGVTVSAISGDTTEAGGTATFTVVLTTEPVGDVVVLSASNDATEGVVTSGASLLFDSSNWDTPQTVTVTGQDDDIADGDIAYSIVTSMDTAATTDNNYDNANPLDRSLQNIDDGDAVGVNVSAISNNTTEAGATATFTVNLTSQPTDTVVINSVSGDSTEGVVTSGSVLTFETGTWNIAQTITVTGQNDNLDDGDILYSITTTVDAALTEDDNYDAINPDDVAVTNIDNDTAGVSVSAVSGTTTESGGTATISVVLNTEPTGNVVIEAASNDATEGVVTAGATLTFTTENWNTPQFTTVTGQDDDIADGDIEYSIIMTTDQDATNDALYDAINPDDAVVTNIDNDAGGITVSAISNNTTEAGATATFTVVLQSEPVGVVVVNSESDDETEGIVTGGSVLTFNSGNWDTPQTVTVTGQDDFLDDEDVQYVIIVTLDQNDTTDVEYAVIDPDDVTVVNEDDGDTLGVTVSAISNNTTEAGATATFTVVLDSEPEGDVVIDSISNDSTEGLVTSGGTLTFDDQNWTVPQTVTVTGVNDTIDDGNVNYTIEVEVDDLLTTATGYGNVPNQQVEVVNEDDGDAAGFGVSAISNNTTEAGTTATFTVVLESEPTGDVVINSISSDTTEAIIVSGASRVFDASNWSTPQTVTIAGVDDDVDDGNIDYTIDVTINEALTDAIEYIGAIDEQVEGTNEDDDTAGFTLSAISSNTTEAGGVAAFTVVLDSEPTGDVVINSVSGDMSEGVVTTGVMLTFTPADWNDPQTVIVTGQNDDIDDGNVAYVIDVEVDAPDTQDALYDILPAQQVNAQNTDNDTVGFTVSAASGNTTEDGGTATFTIRLNSEPTGDVVIDSVSSNASEGVVTSGSTLTFNAGNWNTPQTVTVTGQDDALADGLVAYTILITTDTVETLDPLYDAIDPSDVALSNVDNDSSSFVTSPISNNTTEAGATATFTIVLTTEPTGDVVINSASDSAEGTVTDGATLTFTSINWDTPQTVTVTGQDDDVDDGDVAYTVTVSVDDATSDDLEYEALPDQQVAVTNEDDDTAGLIVSAISNNTTEAGITATYTVQLQTEPTASVTIENVSNDSSEGVVTSGATLNFDALNWNQPQTVTVTGQNDDIDDGDSAYAIDVSVNAGATLDTVYDVVASEEVSLQNIDNDTAGVTVSAVSGNTTEAGGITTFTVVLDTEPTGDVVINSASDDATEGLVTGGATLTFTPLNWSTPQTVTVTGQDDGTVDGDVVYTIEVVINAGLTSDALYDVIDPNDVTLSNTDNDTPSGGGGGGGDSGPIIVVENVNIDVQVSEPQLCRGEVAQANIYIQAKNAAQVVVSDNAYFVGAQWQAYVIDETVSTAEKQIMIAPIEFVADQEVETFYLRLRTAGGNSTNTLTTSVDVSDILIDCENVEEPQEPVEPTEPVPDACTEEVFAPSPQTGELEQVTCVPDNALLVKGTTYSTVYALENGTRKPFMNQAIYFTWHQDFDDVLVVSDATLPFYRLGDPVLPNPANSLVKIQSDPTVYAPILSQGINYIRAIPNEQTAAILFGQNWSDRVIDLPPTLLQLYKTSAPFTSAGQ